jgi:hypothetical protein
MSMGCCLGAFLMLVSLVVIGTIVQAAQGAGSSRTRRRRPIGDEAFLLDGEPYFFTKVVGVTFRNRQEALATCAPGQWLKLVPEPDNPVDPLAVMVTTWDGQQLGYLNAEMAPRYRGALLNRTRSYRVMVAEVTGGGWPRKPRGMNIRISWIPGEVYPPGTPGVWPPLRNDLLAPPQPAVRPAPASESTLEDPAGMPWLVPAERPETPRLHASERATPLASAGGFMFLALLLIVLIVAVMAEGRRSKPTAGPSPSVRP